MNEPLLTNSSLEGVILLVVQSKLAADWLRDRLHGAQLMNRTQFSLEVSGGGCFQICCFIMYCIVKCSSLFQLNVGNFVCVLWILRPLFCAVCVAYNCLTLCEDSIHFGAYFKLQHP